MKHCPLPLLALVLCLGLWSPVPAAHAATTKKKHHADEETTSSKSRKPHHSSDASASAGTRKRHHTAREEAHSAPSAKHTVKRTIPATTTGEDEVPGPVNLGPVDPSHPPAVVAKSVILLDAHTGAVLYEKDADERRTIASTTKLMTALIVAETGTLDHEVTVAPVDTICEPTKLYFRPGERYARSALLYALLVHSCNDVARALARDNAGSIPEFADRMNARAAALGAASTRFANPNGLPSPGEDQYSTARDLSRIARAAYANPILRPIMKTPHIQFQMASGKVQEFSNTNKVLLRFPYCDGMKTGYTDAAGHCLVSSADDGTHAVISVCLGDNKSIWNDSQRLLQYGLAMDH